jgi:thiol-disulfide isomerase/thioredoxin
MGICWSFFQYSGFKRESKHKRILLQMRLTVLVGLGVLLSGCSSVKDAGQEKMALGKFDRALLETPEYRQFKTAYDTVNVDENIVELIHRVKSGVEVTVFMGTWCGDSRREVPKFLRVADAAGIGTERITLYGLDRTKRSGDGLTEQYHIERVPTFIFFRSGAEVGRITESPRVSMEADMLSILASTQSK